MRRRGRIRRKSREFGHSRTSQGWWHSREQSSEVKRRDKRNEKQPWNSPTEISVGQRISCGRYGTTETTQVCPEDGDISGDVSGDLRPTQLDCVWPFSFIGRCR